MKKLFIITSIISSSLFALNLNTASMQELEKIKGIGPKKAKAIIEYRKTHKIKSADELKNIKGFDSSTISNVKNNVIAKKHLKIKAKKEKIKNKKTELLNKTNDKKQKLTTKKNEMKDKLNIKKTKLKAKKTALKNNINTKKAKIKNKKTNIKTKMKTKKTKLNSFKNKKFN